MNTVWLSREVRTIKQARKRGGPSLETKIILFFHFMKHAQAIMGQKLVGFAESRCLTDAWLMPPWGRCLTWLKAPCPELERRQMSHLVEGIMGGRCFTWAQRWICRWADASRHLVRCRLTQKPQPRARKFAINLHVRAFYQKRTNKSHPPVEHWAPSVIEAVVANYCI